MHIAFVKLILATATMVIAVPVSAGTNEAMDKLRASPYIGIPADAKFYEALVPGVVYAVDSRMRSVFQSMVFDENVSWVKVMPEMNGATNMFRVAAPRFDKNPMPKAEADTIIRDALAKINTEKLIKLKYGNGRNKFIMFSALDCPYCKKLEANLERLKGSLDATIYLVPTSLQRSPREAEQVQRIWCSPDPARAWNEARFQQRLPASATDCGLSLLDSEALAMFANATKTPAVFAADGMRVNAWGDTSDSELKRIFGSKQ